MREGTRTVLRIIGGILFVIMLPVVLNLYLIGIGEALSFVLGKLPLVWKVIGLVGLFVVIALVVGFARVISAGGSPGKLSGFFKKED